MIQERISSQEVARCGEEWYDSHIRAVVETRENDFKIVLIDVLTGNYEVGDDHDSIVLGEKIRARNADAIVYKMRIGYDAVYSFGGLRLKPSKMDDDWNHYQPSSAYRIVHQRLGRAGPSRVYH